MFNLGVTSYNIVPDRNHNFVFGLAYLGHKSAVMSLHPLLVDDPSPATRCCRLYKIAAHELGHSVGLEHHSYDEKIKCLMTGDEDVDCLEELDDEKATFCRSCRKKIKAK